MEIESMTMDSEEQGLRDLARETDRNEDRPVKSESSVEKSPETHAPEQAKQQEPRPSDVEVPETEPSSSDLASDIRKQERDQKTGKFQSKQPKTDEKTVPEKPETDYSRAQKEQERKERSWQRLEQEKAEFRAQQAAWEEKARVAQLQQARAQNQPIKKDGLTAQEYFEGFKRFKEVGDYENAAAALEVALELNNAEQGRVQKQNEVSAEYQWRTDMETAVKQLPDLSNPQSPVVQRLETLIKQNPWIYYIPHGFLRAAEIADLQVKLDSMSELQDEVEQLRAEKEKWLANSQPARGGAIRGGRGGDKSFDDMDLDEQDDYLRRATQEADSYR